MKVIYHIFILIVLFSNGISAQEADINDWNILYINAWDNPALTGISNRQFRIQGDFDRQKAKNTYWTDTDLKTMFDTRINIGNNFIGLGGSFSTDKSGPAKYGSRNYSIYTAFHKSIGKKAEHYITLGGQFSFKQVGFGLSPTTSLFFNSQYDPSFAGRSYNPDPWFSNEIFLIDNRNIFDYATGLWYKSKYGFLGVSLKHITTPTIQFLSGTPSPEDAKLYRKLNITGGYNFYINDYTITPSFNFNKSSTFSWQANLLASYKSNYILGLSVKNANRMNLLVGAYLIKHFRLNLGYTLPLASDLKYFGNTFSAGLRFEFGHFKNNRK